MSHNNNITLSHKNITGCFKMNIGVLRLCSIYYIQLTNINNISNEKVTQTILFVYPSTCTVSCVFRDWLNDIVLDRWVGCKGWQFHMASTFTQSDATQFLSLGVHKGTCVMPTSWSIRLKEEDWNSFATITPDMLNMVWEELAYRLDVCRVKKDTHSKNL